MKTNYISDAAYKYVEATVNKYGKYSANAVTDQGCNSELYNEVLGLFHNGDLPMVQKRKLILKKLTQPSGLVVREILELANLFAELETEIARNN